MVRGGDEMEQNHTIVTLPCSQSENHAAKVHDTVALAVNPELGTAPCIGGHQERNVHQGVLI